MSRFACVWVPCFAATAAERCEPALRERPVAVLAGAPPATRVVDANEAARELGVRPGMVEAEARARCPSLVGRPYAEQVVASARHALLEAALAVSPRVEDAGAGRVYIDTAGLGRLIGDPPSVGRRLVARARAAGLPARVGIGSTRTAARLAAALARQQVTVLQEDRERAVLASAPLAVLALDADLAATFARWGIRTLGDLAALPRADVGARLGPAGLAAHDLACGKDRAPFRPYTPPPFWEEAQGLEWELDSLDALATVLRGVLERLCARLAAGHVFADALDLRLQLASGERHVRTVALASPMREVVPMLALIRSELEARPPRAPVTDVAVSVHAVRQPAGQGGLWQPPVPSRRDLTTVLAQLVTLVGRGNLGSPVLGDTRRPDAFTLAPFALPTDEPARATPGSAGLVLRCARPPRRLAVETDGGRPARVILRAAGSRTKSGGDSERVSFRAQEASLDFAGALRASVVPSAGGFPRSGGGRGDDPLRARRVTAWAGPWRASGEWWDARAWAREEWDVALDDGTLCRLAHNHLTGDWYLDGVYD